MDTQRIIKQYQDQIIVKLNNIGRESRAHKRPAILALEKNNLVRSGSCNHNGYCDFCGLDRTLTVVLKDITTHDEYFIGRICFEKFKEIRKLFSEMNSIDNYTLLDDNLDTDYTDYDDNDNDDDSFIVPDDASLDYYTDQDDDDDISCSI
jgi:hypothetical protein